MIRLAPTTIALSPRDIQEYDVRREGAKRCGQEEAQLRDGSNSKDVRIRGSFRSYDRGLDRVVSDTARFERARHRPREAVTAEDSSGLTSLLDDRSAHAPAPSPPVSPQSSPEAESSVQEIRRPQFGDHREEKGHSSESSDGHDEPDAIPTWFKWYGTENDYPVSDAHESRGDEEHSLPPRASDGIDEGVDDRPPPYSTLEPTGDSSLFGE